MVKKLLSANGERPLCPLMSTIGSDGRHVGVMRVPCMESDCQLWDGLDCSLSRKPDVKDDDNNDKDVA